MKITHFVETTRERYIAHRDEYISYKHGGRYDVSESEPCDQFTQEKVYHNADISDIGQRPVWTLVAMAMFQRYHPEHSQYFVLEEVTLGVTHREVK